MFPVFKDSPPARRQLGPRAWPPQAHWLPHHWTPLQPGACTRLNLQILTAGQRAGGGASAVWILLRNCLVLLAFDVLNFSLKLVMWPRSRTTESDWLRRQTDWDVKTDLASYCPCHLGQVPRCWWNPVLQSGEWKTSYAVEVLWELNIRHAKCWSGAWNNSYYNRQNARFDFRSPGWSKRHLLTLKHWMLKILPQKI